jgi:hypothetical protein
MHHIARPTLASFLVSTALLLAPGGADAVFLNSNGLGEALVYPYYVANEHKATLFSLTNASSDGKAIKVRFLEGYNGRDVLSFNLYLPPKDMWVAQVFKLGVGAAIVTFDASCTVPAIPQTVATAMPFSKASFDGSSTQGSDGGPQDASRTLEGHIEVVEMGTISGDSLDAVSHAIGNNPPPHCSVVQDAWSAGGYWTSNSRVDIGPPTGGLYGSAAILDVALGTVEAYSAEALGQFYISGGTGLHTSPGALDPNISSATSLTGLAFADGAPLSLTFTRGVDAVSAVFMADGIYNDYLTSTSIAADSEWVITYPTKRFYADPYYVGSNATAPFDKVFGAPGSSCSPFGLYYYNREQITTDTSSHFAGQPLPAFTSLCTETQVITFRQGSDYAPQEPSNVLGSELVASNIATLFEEGWAKIDLTTDLWLSPLASRSLTAVGGHRLIGQPVSGFLVSQFVNGNVSGALANYTALYRHKTTASCKDSGNVPCL